MRKLYFILTVAILPVFSFAQFNSATPPVAEKKSHWRVIHNDSIADPYFWMYDYFGKGPDTSLVVENLKEENAYLEKVMSNTLDFRNQLFNEMKSRIKEKDEDVPVFNNGYYYYHRTEPGNQYFKYCRKKESLKAKEEILLDVDQMAIGHPYYNVTGMEVSEDNRLLAFAVDELSRLQYSIYIKDLTTGKILNDKIDGTGGDPCWANDNKTIFYTSNNQLTLLSEKIKRHHLGEPQQNDAIVYDEKDNSNYISVFKSKNNQYILIKSEGTLSTEIEFINANKPDENFKCFQPRMKNVLYNVFCIDNKFLILTNKDDARNFKIMQCGLNNTSSNSWVDYLSHNDNILIENIEEFNHHIILQERENGFEQIVVKNIKNKTEYKVADEEADCSVSINFTPDFNSHSFRYNFSSLKTPNTVYEFEMLSGKKMVLKKQEIIGGYNPANYTTERIMVTARDGIKVPVSLIYKNGFNKNGEAPLLLYGYGSYGYSTEASFSSSRLSLLNRGFCFAIAHIRGGQEMGRKWYEDGKLLKKKNSFYDFIDCAEYLINEKYTSSTHLYAMGRSAGGLLMGAVTTMAPDLWNGIIAEVPFVDVINTMMDENIPLTTNEFDEWGNPNKKEYYDYMNSYNPYENVKATNYPNMLVSTGLHDSQVQYFEPQKWVAKLRAMKKDNHLLMLHTNMNFGHGGASGRFDYLKDVALNYTFLLTLEGINK
ncbi:MAG: S9 family peptidase [Bacteroidota bacterium]